MRMAGRTSSHAMSLASPGLPAGMLLAAGGERTRAPLQRLGSGGPGGKGLLKRSEAGEGLT